MLFLDHIRHIENKHETVKKGECSRCHKQFGTKSSAERHEQKCILTFTAPDSIPSEIMNPVKEKETLKRIMSKNSLTKKCPLCNLFFEKRSNLRRHVLRNNVLANVYANESIFPCTLSCPAHNQDLNLAKQKYEILTVQRIVAKNFKKLLSTN